MRKKTSFTLLELMMVIAIIGILITMLLPSLGKARQSARDAVCKSNLRQTAIWGLTYLREWQVLPHNGPTNSMIGNASEEKYYNHLSRGFWDSKADELYVSANDGVENGFYSRLAETGSERHWLRINEETSLHCPQLVGNSVDWWWQGVGNHYSMNRWMGGRKMAGTNEGPYIPTQYTLSSEAWWFSEGDVWDVREGGYSVYRDYSLHNPQYALVSGNQMPWVWEFENEMEIHPKRKANFVFGDGHVKSLSKQWVLDLDDSSSPTVEDDLIEFNGKWKYSWR